MTIYLFIEVISAIRIHGSVVFQPIQQISMKCIEFNWSTNGECVGESVRQYSYYKNNFRKILEKIGSGRRVNLN